MIAFLGTGLMGAAFVRAFIKRGENVIAWNRTRARAEPLAADGARIADDPADAVRGASRVHISVLDDAAVDAVLERIVPALEPGAIVIDHSTTAPVPTAERARRLAERGVRFLHAPVFMAPQNALDSTGVMLVAGPTDIYEEVRGVLDAMSGKVRYFGERPDLAAGYKLFGNMEMIFVLSGLAEVFSLARGLGIDPRDALSMFDDFHPGNQIAIRGPRMANRDLTATFELSATRKDVRLMLDAAAAVGAPMHVLPAIARRIDAVIAAGHGADDIVAIGLPDIQ